MATSSIKREVVITDAEQAEKFVEALEESMGMNEIEQLKQLIEWFDNTPFEDMPEKTQKEISDHLVELVKYKALGTLSDLTALVRAENEGRLVELPVAEGSEIWVITPEGRGPYCANAVISSITSGQVIMEAVWFTGERESVYFDKLGHLVHRTFEAAEAALREGEK